MKLSDNTTEKLLLGGLKLDQAKLDTLKKTATKDKISLQESAVKSNLVSDPQLTEAYGKEIDVPFAAIDVKNLDKETVSALPERIAHQYNAVVFKINKDGSYDIAMSDPEDVQAIDFIKKYIGDNFTTYIATADNILSALDAYRGGVSAELDKVIEIQSEKDPLEETVTKEDVAEDSPIAQTVNLLLEYAIKSEASDIHIEPRDDHISVRYRIDGVLREANKLPKKVHSALVSRVKILSNLKIDERRVPQDGRFKINIGSKRYAFRVSTLPITSGEKIVMRILNESTRALTLEELGYWGVAKARINNAIIQPHGMVLVTGPTGSGKSTSLFSVLSMLNSPDVNISTVEDPVEYKVEGANQTQVNPTAGMTFISGLRALLRQDPNIIMVGEIRDGETANLGVQAALTGHLVFSTLHTNNAATCLPRLLDMGIEPFLIASTVRVVVGQRLVRRLCPNCREHYTPDKQALDHIYKTFNLNGEANLKYIHQLEKQAKDEGIGKEAKDLGSNEKSITGLWHAHKGGCDECHGSGYKGRMGIYEVLENNEEAQKLITANATASNIQTQAVKDGMVTMQMDGLIKALRGETSIEEILRATRE